MNNFFQNKVKNILDSYNTNTIKKGRPSVPVGTISPDGKEIKVGEGKDSWRPVKTHGHIGQETKKNGFNYHNLTNSQKAAHHLLLQKEAEKHSDFEHKKSALEHLEKVISFKYNKDFNKDEANNYYKEHRDKSEDYYKENNDAHKEAFQIGEKQHESLSNIQAAPTLVHKYYNEYIDQYLKDDSNPVLKKNLIHNEYLAQQYAVKSFLDDEKKGIQKIEGKDNKSYTQLVDKYRETQARVGALLKIKREMEKL